MCCRLCLCRRAIMFMILPYEAPSGISYVGNKRIMAAGS